MAEGDLEQDLLTRFSCMGTNDREVLINELQNLVGVHLSREACAFFLEMSNWCVYVHAYVRMYVSWVTGTGTST